MSDEIHDDVEIDDAAIDEDEDAEVEGHVMFAEKKGFSLKPDLFAPPCEPQLDDWERGGYSGNTNEPVLGDDMLDEDEDEDEDAEVEGHVMFAEKKGFGLNPGLLAPPCEPQLDDWERGASWQNTNEPMLGDDAVDDEAAEVAGYAFAGPHGLRPEFVLPTLHDAGDLHPVRFDALTLNANEPVLDDVV